MKPYMLLAVFIGFSVNLLGQNPQMRFDVANQQLNDGLAVQAMETYRSIQNDGFESGGLYVNMAYVAIQLDSLGLAKYYFLKAAEFSGMEEEAEKGIRYVENRMRYRTAVLPKLPWDVAIEFHEKVIGAKTMLYVGLGLLNLAALIQLSIWFLGWFKPVKNWIAVAIALFALFHGGASFFISYHAERYDQAVQITKETKLYEAPSTDAALLSNAFEGYTYVIDHHKSENEPGWWYVRMSNGTFGWILRDNLRLL